MKIVALDALQLMDLDWSGLRAIDPGLVTYDATAPERVVERAKDAEILLVNKVKLTREVLEQLPALRYVGVLATGYDNVDCAAAREKGVVVTNVPGYSTDSVAQLVFALLLELCHQTGHHSDTVKAGRWANQPYYCYWDSPLIELAGKTMGIIGFGRIGQDVGKLAQAFGMKVLAFDNHKRSELESDTMRYAELDELFAESDVISLHCPLFPSTQGIINAENIKKMKDGVIILNDSRGPLIVEQDLYDALESGKVAAAAVDVVSTEPIREDNVLLKAKNMMITPHIAWAPKESRARLMDVAVKDLEAFLAGSPINVVNA